MLGSYMEDIGITSAQFEDACQEASSKISSKFHRTLFEQASSSFPLLLYRTTVPHIMY